MTSRERLVAAARGGPVDHAPWFPWSPSTPSAVAISFAKAAMPDLVVVEGPFDAQAVLAEVSDPAVLVEVLSPFGKALEAGVNLNAEFDSDPESGQALLDAYAAGVASSLRAAVESGADGVMYRLFGADETSGSPMQYGGRFLETDRSLLESVADARFNVLFAEGEQPYLDCLTDLNASAISWEGEAPSPRTIRQTFSGAVACGLGGDVRSLWEEMLGIGIIFSAKVPELNPAEFDDTLRLMEELTTIYV